MSREPCGAFLLPRLLRCCWLRCWDSRTSPNPSIKIPKYQYVEFDFSFWAKCGRRWAGDWIGGSSGSTSPGDCAANGCGAAATFVGDFAISDLADEPGRTGADHSGLFAEPVGLCRGACD